MSANGSDEKATDAPVDHCDEFVDARDARHEAKKAEDEKARREATRQMWRAAEGALNAAAQGHNLDREIAEWVAFLLHDLPLNRSPEEFEDIRTAGGVSDSVAIVGAKRDAVMYDQAVAAGHITDNSPNKTVREKYGVSDQTVRDWKPDFPTDLWEKFRPNDVMATRVRYLEIALKHGARVMRSQSRSQEGIRASSKKTPT